MIKLLLLLLIGFAFTEINAQEHIVSTASAACFSNVFEYQSVTSPNAWDAYDVFELGGPTGFDALSPWGIAQGASLGNSAYKIRYNVAQSRWEMFSPSQLLFIQDTYHGTSAPANGWSGFSVCFSVPDPMSMVSENSGVLPVDREEFSDIKIYPNPSTGFINISNLKENSRVVISNITGQVVKDVVVGINDNKIDIQDLSQGFYFVELEGKKTIKLLKR